MRISPVSKSASRSFFKRIERSINFPAQILRLILWGTVLLKLSEKLVPVEGVYSSMSMPLENVCWSNWPGSKSCSEEELVPDDELSSSVLSSGAFLRVCFNGGGAVVFVDNFLVFLVDPGLVGFSSRPVAFVALVFGEVLVLFRLPCPLADVPLLAGRVAV